MRVFIDTNVVLDYVIEGRNFHRNALGVIRACEDNHHQMFISATCVTTIHHVAKKEIGLTEANLVIDDVLELFEVVPVDHETLKIARAASGKDFEDNVQVVAAHHSNADFIITRNIDDFDHSSMPVKTPGAFLKHLRELGEKESDCS